MRLRLLLIVLAAIGLGLVVTGAQADTAPPSPDPGWHQITLVGMVLRQVGPSFAVIQDPLTGKTEFYPLGASVKGARLSRFLPDRVVLTQGDARLVLRLGVAGAKPAESVTETPASSQSDVRHGSGARGRLLTVAAAQGAPARRTASHIVRPADHDESGSDSGGAGTGGGDASISDTQSGASVSSSPSAQLRISGLHHNGAVKVQTQFATGELRDLHFDVDYFQVSGSHRQRLELFGPDGTLYQRRFLDVSVAAGQPVNTRVPVGGTWITDHSLFGNWRVVVYLDSSQTPIATGAFALNP